MRQGDRGAVLVIVAAFVVVAAIFLAFVVDIGNQRQNRRQLTTETDAVALSAAKDWAQASLASSFDDCADAPSTDRLRVYNNPTKNASADPNCVFTSPNPFQGYVTVTDDEFADFAFDGVTGVSQGETGATSTVAISVVRGGGLRPLALCLNDLDIQSWLLTGSPTQFDIYAPRGLNPLCTSGVSSPGNWSQVVLPPSGANQNDWTDDVENGAGDDVVVNQVLDNLTGVGMNSAADEFEALEGTTFFLPVYLSPILGPGSHVEYPVSGFLEVRLVSSDISGASPSFLIEPLRLQTAGTCCYVNGFNSQYAMCDVGTIGGEPAMTSELAANCLDPLPPLVTTTTQPPTCVAEAISVTPDSASWGSGNRLTTDVQVDVTVDDLGLCSDLTVQFRERSGPGVNEIGTNVMPLAETFTLTELQDDTHYKKNTTYDVVILDSSGQRIPAPAASLAIGS